MALVEDVGPTVGPDANAGLVTPMIAVFPTDWVTGGLMQANCGLPGSSAQSSERVVLSIAGAPVMRRRKTVNHPRDKDTGDVARYHASQGD